MAVEVGVCSRETAGFCEKLLLICSHGGLVCFVCSKVFVLSAVVKFCTISAISLEINGIVYYFKLSFTISF